MCMKRLWLTVCLAVCLLLSGCNGIDLRIQTQLVPPGLVGEQASIQAAFEAYLHASADASEINYRLQFPTSGEYRSAFILQDLNGDGEREAIVLYLPSPESTDIHMNLLSQTEDEWQSVADVATGSATIQEVRFGNVFGDGGNALFLGSSIGSTRESNLRIYRFVDRELLECYSSLYSRVVIAPVSDTRRDDFVLLHLQTDSIGTAKLVTVDGGLFETLSTATVDGSVIRYTDSHISVNHAGQVEIAVDGRKETGLITELLVWDGKQLTAPLYDELQGGTTASFRQQALPMTDIGNDGLMEWPVMLDEDGEVRTVAWMRWDPELARPAVIYNSYLCAPNDYEWLWPEENWPMDAVASYDGTTNTLDIREADGALLFSIRMNDNREFTVTTTERCPLDQRVVRGRIRSLLAEEG